VFATTRNATEEAIHPADRETIRAYLFGPDLAMFDMVADGAKPVEAEALFEGSNTREAISAPKRRRRRVARYAARLNVKPSPFGWKVARVGRSTYALHPAPRSIVA